MNTNNNIIRVAPNELICRAPFSTLFPPQPKIVEAIVASMREHGYDQAFPIITWNGVVVDGHTRLEAAKQAQVDAFHIDHPFSDETAALKFAIACQKNRRALTDAELARCVLELDKRMTPKDAGAKGAQGCAGSGPSSAATAAVTGTSRRKVEQIRTVFDHATPEVKAAVLNETKSINSACRETIAARKKPVAADAAIPSGASQWSFTLSLTVVADTEDAARHAAAVEINDMAASAIEDILTCKCRAQRKELAPRATRPTSPPDSTAEPRSSTRLDENTPFFLE